ncbi:MAG: prolipoprotein diacylglyceryl transferase [Deltaproteobacteria bacterium]|nr:prolipoprotein diacylglyceryl transferase [Deltaproteobacteria bacterium]
MLPILLKIPLPFLSHEIPIYTYGLLVATAFLAGIWWSAHEAKKVNLSPDFVFDLSFYIVVAAIIGSRVLYIVVDYDRYLSHPLDILKIWEGGLVFYGGLIAAIGTSLYYAKRKKTPFLVVADLFTPGVALGHAIGRLGCFAAGCCYGRPVTESHFWAVTFPHNGTSLAPAGIPLYPTQLMESAAELALFLILIALRRRKKFTGQIFLSYVVLYGISRSVLEVFRGDAIRGFVIPGILSTSQLISGLLISAAIIYSIYLKKRRSV